MKPATSPATLMPVTPAAPAAPAGAALASAARKASDIAPVATLPIATADAAVNAFEPGAAPFACNKNAARFT